MNNIYNNLLELTKGSFFHGIDKLEYIVSNTDDFINCIDLSDCVEFGTYNGQEMIIYNAAEGRKHIKYSAMFTRLFDEIIIQNIYNESGKVFEYDFNTTFDKLEALKTK